jgi:hypothetical protein
MAATLAFGQAADRPASTTDRQDANAPTAPELTTPHEMTTIGVGSVSSGWQDSVVSLGANATSATEIGIQRTSAERPKTLREEPL